MPCFFLSPHHRVMASFFKSQLILALRIALVMLGVSFNNAKAQSYPPLPAMEPDSALMEFVQDLDIYLITVEVSDKIADNFGHTGFRVINKKANTDLMFNWGLYDLQEPVVFAVRFYLGELRYRLGAYPFKYVEHQYTREQRTIWQDKLLLTNEEKATLWQRMTWNLKKENRVYDYQYFFDNCSTRPRDYLDEALGGILNRHTTADASTGTSFRDMVRSHYATNPFVQLSLDLLMNGDIDQVMSVWQKMFLPKTLREVLLDLERSDGSRVMEPDQTILNYDPPVALGLTGHQYFFIFVAGLLVLAAVFVRLRRHGLGVRLLGLSALVTGLYLGLVGLVMPLNWFFSGHTDLHHNANMFFLWPLDMTIAWSGMGWMVTGRFRRLGRKKARSLFWRRAYWGGHLLSICLGTLMFALGLIEQHVEWTIFYIAPILIVFSVLKLKRP